MWKIFRRLLAAEAPNNVNESIHYCHSYHLDTRCYCYSSLPPHWKFNFQQGGLLCFYNIIFNLYLHPMWLYHWYLEKVSPERRHFSTTQ